MPADDLIAELEEAATDIRGFPDFRFSEMAREDLAAFRENHQREQSLRTWSVPERYFEAEEFIVFSAFVHAYLSPILTTHRILELIREVGGSEYTAIQFSRFEDTASFDLPVTRNRRASSSEFPPIQHFSCFSCTRISAVPPELWVISRGERGILRRNRNRNKE